MFEIVFAVVNSERAKDSYYPMKSIGNLSKFLSQELIQWISSRLEITGASIVEKQMKPDE